MRILRIRKVINEPVEIDEDGVHVRGGVSASISANVNETGGTHSSTRQRVKVVQRGGRTEVFEHENSTTDTDDEPRSDEGR